MLKKISFCTLLMLGLVMLSVCARAQTPELHYTVSAPQAASHLLHVNLDVKGLGRDTIRFKMPKWTPGYYQLLHYANAVSNVTASDSHTKNIAVRKLNDNTWEITGVKGSSFQLQYDVNADKQFVAQSYVDSLRGYLVPAGIFFHPEGRLDLPSRITLNVNKGWKTATGLQMETPNEFTAPNFDMLYDCPILMGKLEELPSFRVQGIEHRFIGHNLGNFDRKKFMANLEKVVVTGVKLIDDIPYRQYTFIAIGPSRGGIEHLNNTTFGFDGNTLDQPASMNRMLNFLAHEYYHHYNVKRIRPFELGPFDYDKGSRTNLLWVSEGISVYYEYMIVKRAGLKDEQTLYADFQKNINATENNPGRFHQSLTQASYKTWSDGPFGTQGEDASKSISYYDKGPVVGLLLDFAIRQSTENKKSLDDVMRILYWQYYKKLQRGFTDAEFQQACEDAAGKSLAGFFEYVYTTRELDYKTYLGYAGLTLDIQDSDGKKQFSIRRMEKMDSLQAAILKSWLGE